MTTGAYTAETLNRHITDIALLADIRCVSNDARLASVECYIIASQLGVGINIFFSHVCKPQLRRVLWQQRQ